MPAPARSRSARPTRGCTVLRLGWTAALAMLWLACGTTPGALLPEELADSQRAAGLARLAATEPAFALRELTPLLRHRPDDAALHHGVALAYRARGEPGLARWHLARAIALDPAHPTAWLDLAALSLELGRYPDAITAARGCLAVPACQDRGSAWFRLGWAELLSGRSRQAREAFRSARAEDADGLGLFGLGVLERVEGHPGRALGLFQEALHHTSDPARSSEMRDRIAEARRALGVDTPLF